jgi:AbrB family looped-hinge helix DNA binding protein
MTPHGEKTVKVGPKGQVVVPKEIRDRVGIHPGQRVRVTEEDGEVRVRRLATLDELRGVFKDAPGRGTRDLEERRRRDRKLEDAKAGRWRGRRG